MLLDIAFGLFAGKYFGYKLLGVIFALLPDLDFITNYIYEKKKCNLLKPFTHRGLIHTPFLFICTAIILYLLNFDNKLVSLFLICTIFHLIHDLFVLGRGVMIFYPFTNNKLKLFPDDGKDGYLKKKYLWWNEDLEPKYSSTGIDNLDNDNWIKVWYLRPNAFLIVETSLAIIFITIAFL